MKKEADNLEIRFTTLQWNKESPMIGTSIGDENFQTQGRALDYYASMGWSYEGEGQNIGCV